MTSGVAWIDRQLQQLQGAREFLERAGMAPQQTHETREHRYAGFSRWRLPHVVGSVDDAELIQLAIARGFRG